MTCPQRTSAQSEILRCDKEIALSRRSFDETGATGDVQLCTCARGRGMWAAKTSNMNRNNNHPAGLTRRWSWKLGELFASLAKKLKYPALASVPVSAAMLSRVDAVSPEQPLEVAAQLLVGGRHAQLPVIDHGRPIGVITRDDVATALQSSGPNTLVAAACCHNVLSVEPGDSLSDVLEQLRALPDAVAIVLDHGAPVGLLTFEHLAAYLAQSKKTA